MIKFIILFISVHYDSISWIETINIERCDTNVYGHITLKCPYNNLSLDIILYSYDSKVIQCLCDDCNSSFNVIQFDLAYEYLSTGMDGKTSDNGGKNIDIYIDIFSSAVEAVETGDDIYGKTKQAVYATGIKNSKNLYSFGTEGLVTGTHGLIKMVWIYVYQFIGENGFGHVDNINAYTSQTIRFDIHDVDKIIMQARYGFTYNNIICLVGGINASFRYLLGTVVL